MAMRDLLEELSLAAPERTIPRPKRRVPAEKTQERPLPARPARAVNLPGSIRRAGKRLVQRAEDLVCEYLGIDVHGAAYVPHNQNFLVVANHCSHLDACVLRNALGSAGPELVVTAAADYFFTSRLRSTLFTNFTNLCPLDRTGGSRNGLDAVVSRLVRGYTVLTFPEGTRSVAGSVGPFLPGMGYMAIKSGVGVLPAYVNGTREALPKGARTLRPSRIRVSFGPFLTSEIVAQLAVGQSPSKGYHQVALAARTLVEALRDGARIPSTPEALLAHLNAQIAPRSTPSSV